MGDKSQSKHWGTGKVVTDKKEIPPWRGKPQGTGPWERTACGSYVPVGTTASTKGRVTCSACKRTHLWRDDD